MAKRWSQREGRAIALIALAVIVTVVAGLAYVHSALTSKPPNPTPLAVNRQQTTIDYVAYDFSTPSLGWALDFSEGRPPSLSNLFWIFRTTDRGAHWHKQLAGQSIFRGFGARAIQAFDQNHVFVLVRGVTEQLYRSIDGGTHWSLVALPRTQIEELQFLDPQHGWLLTQPTPDTAEVRELYATNDAGGTWNRLANPPADAYVIQFRGAAEVWMSGFGPGNPHVYTSTDTGGTWWRHDLPPPPSGSWSFGNYLPAGIDLLPGTAAMASVFVENSSVPFLFLSLDQGTTWSYRNPPPGQVAYQDAKHWWAMKSNLLFKTSDGGVTWSRVSDKLPDWQFAPQILDAKRAWSEISVLGGNGLAFTDDGGIHWTRAAVPQPE